MLVWQQRLASFLAGLAGARASSPHTQKSYLRALERFLTYCSTRQLDAPEAISGAVLRDYVAHCHRQKLSGKSIQLQLAALRAFFRAELGAGRRSDNPALGIKAPRSAKRLPATLDVDETRAFVEHVDADPETTDPALTLRDRAIIELFYGSGLRLAELAALDRAPVQETLAGGRLLRVLGKGRKEREVPLGGPSRDALSTYLASRRDEHPALFLSRHGTRLSTRQIQTRLAQWGKKLGLAAPLHPHKLRHSCASHFLEGAQDLRAVQELLGHANLATTQIYTHLDFQQLAKVYDGAHPRAKKR